MAIPAKVKTWEIVRNQTSGSLSSPALNAQVLRSIKNILKGLSNVPCVVAGSGTQTAGAMDGQDRWAANSDIDGGANNRSWMVLTFPGIGAGFQLLLATAAAAQVDLINMWVSPLAGFTGGGAGTRPTATDERQLLNAAGWGGASGGPFTIKYHVLHSTDGEHTTVLVCRGGVCCGIWMFAKLQGPDLTMFRDSYPAALSWAVGADGVAVVTLANYRTINGKGMVNASPTGSLNFGSITPIIEVIGGSTGVAAAGPLDARNTLSNTFPLLPATVCITEGGTNRHTAGYAGYLADLWASSNTNHVTGDTMGADASHQDWVRVGNLWLPYVGDATAMQFT